MAAASNSAYDNQGRLASLQHVQPGSSSLRQVARYDQAYDAVNRITRIDSSVDEASVYNYDKTGQLLDARQTFENDETYRYDANGNRTSGGTQSAGTHKNLVTQDAKYTYLYDGENNRIRRTERATGNYQLYTWDHRNRLTKVEFVNTLGVTVRAIEYRYDANDQKVAEFVDTSAPFDMANASAKWFIYDGANVVLDFARADMSQAPGAAISKRYFQGPSVDQLLAQENIVSNASQSVWWVLPDHLGSTRDLVTASGSVVAHFQFDSFGNILDGRENVTRYQFTGREHDSNTDLNYHRARWYDPASGKWLSEDPIGFNAGDANVTRYVGNGVLNGVDPSGLYVSPAGVVKGRATFRDRMSYQLFKERGKRLPNGQIVTTARTPVGKRIWQESFGQVEVHAKRVVLGGELALPNPSGYRVETSTVEGDYDLEHFVIGEIYAFKTKQDKLTKDLPLSPVVADVNCVHVRIMLFGFRYKRMQHNVPNVTVGIGGSNAAGLGAAVGTDGSIQVSFGAISVGVSNLAALLERSSNGTRVSNSPLAADMDMVLALAIAGDGQSLSFGRVVNSRKELLDSPLYPSAWTNEGNGIDYWKYSRQYNRDFRIFGG